MKRFFRHLCFLILLSMLFVVSGCVYRFTGVETELYTGEQITPEDIDSIFAAISDSITEKYPIETNSDGELIVYWLENGSVWHSSRSCGVISKSDIGSLGMGCVSDAVSKGKARPCKVCSKEYSDYYETTELSMGSEYISDDMGVDQTSKVDYEVPVDSSVIVQETTSNRSQEETAEIQVKYPKEYNPSGVLIVYWLKNGTVWHESKYCGSVLKASSDSVFTGTPDDAFSAGKERACKICASDSNVVINIQNTTTSPDVTAFAADKYPKEYDANGELIVFWLANGTVWHESKSCSVFADVSHDRIISGSVSEAVSAQKERACKRCS